MKRNTGLTLSPKRKHGNATAEEIANWKMPKATKSAIAQAEQRGRKIAAQPIGFVPKNFDWSSLDR